MSGSPASARICAACSELVPTMRTTIGTWRSCMAARLDQAVGDLVAARDAAEDVDQDRPHALRRTGSGSSPRQPCRALAPPPMSRKLAGLPPARLIRSIVVIARPAPLTMQPIVPSSRMNDRPCSRATMSTGSSSSRSRICSSAGWRESAESSIVILASRHCRLSRRGAVVGRAAHDGERVDLDQVGVVGDHRFEDARRRWPRTRAGAFRRDPSSKASSRAW